MKSLLVNKYNLILIIIFFIAFVLRYLYIANEGILFGYDQGRDAFIVDQILKGDLKILGPPTSGVPGFFHGVLYYYFILPGYLVGSGSPLVAATWLAVLTSAVVFLVYYLTLQFTKDKRVSILASLLYAVSFEMSQYGTWLSNPSMGVIFVPLVYLGLYLWVFKKDKKGLVLTLFSLGLTIQSNIALAYHTIPVLFWLWNSRKQFSQKMYLLAAFSFLVSMSTMILAEIKFGFKGIGGFSHLFIERGTEFKYGEFGTFINHLLNDYGDLFANNLFPNRVGFGGMLGLTLVWYLIHIWKKEAKGEIKDWRFFLLTWILSYLVMAPFGGLNTPHITVGLGIGVLIMTASVIFDVSKKNRGYSALLLLIIMLANIKTIVSENKSGQTIFAIQKDMVLNKQLRAIDYTYEQANGDKFSINSLTSPLFINTTWSYLYNWYGVETYKYLPEWRGKDQVGSLGNNLPQTLNDTNYHFYIIEDMAGIPSTYLEWGIGEEDSRSILLEEKIFGNIRVQKREIREVNDDQN